MAEPAASATSRTLFIMMITGLSALAGSAILYVLDLPQDSYVFLAGMIIVLSVGAASALRREGGASMEDALPLLAGIAFFAWLAWKTFGR